MAFSSGRLEVRDMVEVGGCLGLLGVMCVLLVTGSIGTLLFDLGDVPAWASVHAGAGLNTTASGNGTGACGAAR